MRRRGVEGLIIRATHGQAVDKRLAEYVGGARGAGYPDADLGFYSFINPKRGSASECADATVAAIAKVLGHTNTFYMLDVEAYAQEPPDEGQAPVFGPAFAAWLREHIQATRMLAPDMRIIGYTNASFWDGRTHNAANAPRWVGDAQLAAELEWIVPRYPVYPKTKTANDPTSLAAWIQSSTKPPDPGGWADWAFGVADGPKSPGGVAWAGWQFSAGYNRQGRGYGCSCDDLDLNIVRTESWQRWTATGVIPFVDGPNVLHPGVALAVGDQRLSPDGGSVLVHQSDGNVVVYSSGVAVWATGTHGNATAAFAMQDDGNLVLYGGDGTALWAAGTHGNPGAALRLEDGGRVVVVSSANQPLWTSAAAPPPVSAAPRRTTTVRPGEGWIKIAKRTLGSAARWPEIAKLNGGEGRELHPNDIVLLP